MIHTLADLVLEHGGHDMLAPITRQDFAPAPDDDFWYAPTARPTATGVAVSEHTSLQSTAMWACVRIISETIASLPLCVYERIPNGGKREMKDHPLYYVLHDSANEEQTSFEYWEQSGAHLLTWGNSYAFQRLDTKGNVSELRAITPDRVQVVRDKQTGIRVYMVAEDGGQQKPYTESEILHIPGLGFDGLKGYSPVHMLRQAIGLTVAAEEYGAKFFGNSALPGMYITHPGRLSDSAAKNLKDSWDAVHKGLRGSHKTGILEEGMKIETVPVNHRDLQFLELRKFQLEEIARIYRVPLHLIQSLDRATNNNIEHQAIDFVMHTIRPWAVRIERRINKSLFGPRESQRFFAEFNLDGLLRGDAASRAAFYSALRNIGAITANEIRARENMNPHANPAADELYVQGAMVPLGQQIEQGVQNAA